MPNENDMERWNALHDMDTQTASERDAEQFMKDDLITEDEYKDYVGEDYWRNK
ncbi:hypothetical protein RB298_27030 [Priestia sp. BR_2]